jgi:hypothetical protein
MRRTLIGLVAGVALVAAACGGNDSDTDAADDEAADTSETTTNGSDDTTDTGNGEGDDAEDGGEFADTEFCNQFEELNQIADADEALDRLRSLEPPDELAEDHTTLVASFDTLAAIDEDELQENPEILNEFQDEITAFNGALTNINNGCGIQAPTG